MKNTKQIKQTGKEKNESSNNRMRKDRSGEAYPGVQGQPGGGAMGPL